MSKDISQEPDLNRVAEILAAMSDEDRQVMESMMKAKDLATVRAAISQVCARNFSHNVGDKVKETLKK